MQLTEKIVKALEKVAGEKKVHLETPELAEHGDYSSNIALTLFSQNKERRTKNKEENRLLINQLTTLKSSRELAGVVVNRLKKDKELIKVVDKIEVAGPGFINFWLKKEILLDELSEVIEKRDEYGNSDKLSGKKIMLEFADPNPFKDFHIGHFLNISTGESMARLMESQGAELWRVNYQGDVGMHVAKAIWGLKKMLSGGESTLKDIEAKPLGGRVDILGKGYVEGNTAYEEDENAKKEILEINKAIYNGTSGDLELWKKGRKWSLDNFEKVYERVGTKYKRYYFESEVADRGKKIVEENTPKIFEKSQGAVVFPGDKYGLHTRVFITKDGYPTYEAKDIGLAPTKYEDFAYDLSIIITGPEQVGYWKVVKKALELINPELGKKTIHEHFGMVGLKEGKMGSRFGNVVTANHLIDLVKDAVNRIMDKSELSGKEKDEIAEKVAVGAVKWGMLKVARGKDINFDMDEAVSLEGDSGPYLQYSYARCLSVLEKAKYKKQKEKIAWDGLEIGEHERNLLRTIIHFPEVVEEAAEKYAPNLICNYLFNLGQKFNSFYNSQKIIGGDNEKFRLTLTLATGTIIRNGLYLLGIETPNKM